ncbi:MAG: glutamine--fructose-6-phosphate transaminase (isomerizing) [Burkholderia sp.]|nr:glutamine--fructose-6-phosphate transaminase (isomerizing) [Burkholderia sp.]
MCGIAGAVSRRNIVPVLIEGLRKLEYRGYDSCGIVVLVSGALRCAKSLEQVSCFDMQIRDLNIEGVTGIAHTRWATHGAPVIDNAHPVFSSDTLAIVHNGIIENFESLRDTLRSQGYVFISQTDTEVIAHLVHSFYCGDLFSAVRKAVLHLHGSYAIGVVHRDHPHTVVGARAASSLIIGHGNGENFIASDALAIAGSTNRFTFLEEGDVCELSIDNIKIADRNGNIVKREVQTVSSYSQDVKLGSYRHFMQKEIFEQPKAIANTIAQVEKFDATLFGNDAAETFAGIDGILILACGTSYYSGMTAKYWLESMAKIPTQIEIASEYRYRDSVMNSRQLVIVISQSGETADTLGALRHAQLLGHRQTLAICNVPTSTMMQLTKYTFLTQAGIEIGVASTKAFTTQLVALFILSAILGKLRGHISVSQEVEYIKQLRHLPSTLNNVLKTEPQIITWANEFAKKENALFLGRGLHYPISLEGALKLKEISYIHAEAYPAGELKHGPLSLITKSMPVVTVAPNNILLKKLMANMQEVHARGGELYVLADADTCIFNGDKELNIIRMPEHYGLLSPILHIVPLQLLAYHTACIRGTNVDKPRNLAKSVTVE